MRPKNFSKKLKNYFYVGQHYRKEVRKQLRMFITFTFGFTIAFTWREYMYEGSKNLIKWLTGTSHSGAFGAAMFITIVSLGLTFLTSMWLKERPKSYYRHQ